MSQQRVIVYGGSGFLGSHVSDTLSASGFRVKIFDLKPSPYLRSDQEMIVGDLMDLEAVVQAAEDCQYVYNFAGISSIEEAKDKPLKTARVNILGNVHALEAARQGNAKRFIYASSVYVYSDAGSFYRVGKQASERFVEAYHERYGLDYTILRYASLYGRRADEHNGIYQLLKQALEQKSITYEGSEDAVREYIHVTDAARLSVQILEDEYTNRHLILTGQERLPVKSLMKMIAEIVPGDIELHFGNKKVDGHYDLTPYAFQPKVGHKLIPTDYVDLGQGLLDCLSDIHERLNLDEPSDRKQFVSAKPCFENRSP